MCRGTRMPSKEGDEDQARGKEKSLMLCIDFSCIDEIEKIESLDEPHVLSSCAPLYYLHSSNGPLGTRVHEKWRY